MMQKKPGFTLIELIIFIIVIGILANTILLSLNTILQHSPKLQEQNVSMRAASRCAEWYLGQRYLAGFGSIVCPDNSVPLFCTIPSGYNISTTVSCTTINGDPNYRTINIHAGFGSKTQADLSLLIADY